MLDNMDLGEGMRASVGRLVEMALRKRISGLRKWLRQNAPECGEEQKHLEEGTPERVYWHYGYMVALRDILTLIHPKSPFSP